MRAPRHLSHNPIIEVSDYESRDGLYANKTDARALSIGEAQYDKRDISLKVWRHSGDRWSRQSEELPLHRNIDLNILLIGALMTDEASNFSKTALREVIVDKAKFSKIRAFYKSNESFLKPRLKELRNQLNVFLKKNIEEMSSCIFIKK